MSDRVLVVTSVASMVSSFLLPHIDALQAQGLTVDVATNFQEGSTIPDGEVNALRRSLAKRNVLFHDLPFTRQPLSLGNVRASYELYQIVTSNGYRFLHAHTPTGGVVSRLVGSLCGVPTVYTAHGFHFTHSQPGIAAGFFRILERSLARLTHLLITINTEDAAVAETFKPLHHAYTHGIGVSATPPPDTKRSLRTDLEISDTAILIMSVGELNRNKNHKSVVKALSRVTDLDFHYAIAGQGNGNHLESLIRELNLVERVTLLGYQRDAAALVHEADLFVHPSLREGLPIALAEALLAGVPVVASDIRGNRDLVTHGENGLLFDVHDEDTLVHELRRAISNAALRQQLAQHAQESMRPWTLEPVLMETLNAYRLSGLLTELGSG